MPATDITPRLMAGRPLIESYGGGGFKVAGIRHVGSILIHADGVIPWTIATADEVTAEAMTDVLAAVNPVAEPLTILLIGCGPAFLPPPPPVVTMVRACAIAPEWMDTGAACRTYNVLLLEGRRVAAALIAVD